MSILMLLLILGTWDNDTLCISIIAGGILWDAAITWYLWDKFYYFAGDNGDSRSLLYINCAIDMAHQDDSGFVPGVSDLMMLSEELDAAEARVSELDRMKYRLLTATIPANIILKHMLNKNIGKAKASIHILARGVQL